MERDTCLTSGLLPIHWSVTATPQCSFPAALLLLLLLLLAPQPTLTSLLTHTIISTSQVPPLLHPAWPGKDVLPSTRVTLQENEDGQGEKCSEFLVLVTIFRPQSRLLGQGEG